MSYSDAYHGANDGCHNIQPDPSATAYVPGAQQQNLFFDPTTGYPYQAWQQQQPYLCPDALDFNVAPPPLAPARPYVGQPRVPGYNGPAYTGSLDAFVPQLPPAPPAHQAYYAALPPSVRAAYDNPLYPDAAEFFARQGYPPVPAYDNPVYPGAPQPPAYHWQIDLADLTPAFIACVARVNPAFALALHAYALRHADPELEAEAEPQEVEYQEVELELELEPEPEPEPEPKSEPEAEAEEGESDEEEQPLSQSHAPAEILDLFYHGMAKAAADDLSALLNWKHDEKGRVECPVPGCDATYTRRFDAMRHVVDNTMVCPHCGRPLSRKSAYFIRRHEDSEVCKEARRAAAARR